MRKLIYTLLLLLSVSGLFAQGKQYLNKVTDMTTVRGGLISDSLNKIPNDTLKPTWYVGSLVGAIAVKNGRFYWFADGKYQTFDTSSLSQRIDQRVKYADTAAMLIGYVRQQTLEDTAAALRTAIGIGGGGSPPTDTTHLSNRIEQRVKYSDTAAMLLSYATKNLVADTAAAIRLAIPSITGKLNSGDTAAMLLPYAKKSLVDDTASAIRAAISSVTAKQSYSDTATFDATKKNLADTAAALRTAIGAGGSGGISWSAPTNNFLAKYNSSGTNIVNSTISDNGTSVTLSTLAGSPTYGTFRIPLTNSSGVISNEAALGYTSSGNIWTPGVYAYGAAGMTCGYQFSTERDVLLNNTSGFTKIKGRTWLGDISSETGNSKLMVRGGSFAVSGGTMYDNPSTGSDGGLILGTTSTYAFLQAYNSSPIVLQPLTGGNVMVGTTTAYSFGAASLTVAGNFTVVDASNSNALISGYYAGTDMQTTQSYGSKLGLNPDGNAVAINTYNTASGAALTVAGPSQLGSMTTANINAIASPATGLQAYDSDLKHQKNYDGTAWRHSPNVYIGTAAPATTPLMVGDLFVDTTGKKIYTATGTSSSADWTILN